MGLQVVLAAEGVLPLQSMPRVRTQGENGAVSVGDAQGPNPLKVCPSRVIFVLKFLFFLLLFRLRDPIRTVRCTSPGLARRTVCTIA